MTNDTEQLSKTAIQIAYGRWAMRQAEREVERNLARLRAIPNRFTIRLLELIDPWPADDQLTMLVAQIKNFLNPRPTHPGVPLFELAERELWALHQLDYFGVESAALKEVSAGRARGSYSLPKGVLRRTVKAKLRQLLGPHDSDSGGEVRYVTHIAGSTIYTDLDFGSRSCQMGLRTESIARSMRWEHWLREPAISS